MSDFIFYFKIGWEHIINWSAVDHVFFIAALAAIYMLKDWKQVLILVTSFTIGHAITLVLSAKNIIAVDERLVEFLIPCTIAITALSNLFLKSFTPKSIRVNYFLALFFGLIHGLAFAQTLKFILAEDQSFWTAWISFSIGLELGQILVVLLILLLAQLFVGVMRLNRHYWVIIISVVVLGLALEMAVDRWPGKEKKHVRGMIPTIPVRSRLDSENRFQHVQAAIERTSSAGLTTIYLITRQTMHQIIKPDFLITILYNTNNQNFT